MATVANNVKVAALYSAIFNRAPDQAGLNFWLDQLSSGATLTDAADGFTQHPVFAQTYSGLTNIQFVQQLYTNVLGSAGDAKGIQYWADRLAAGETKGSVVASFVEGALTIDLAAQLAAGALTQAEYDAAVVRQNTLLNKGTVGVYFAETLGAASNLAATTDTTTAAGLAADPAYQASQSAIANVTADSATVDSAKGRIDVAVGTSNPVDSLIGQNSPLTAALVDLQAKQAAVADALKAMALLDNANTSDGAPVLDNASAPTLDQFTAGYAKADALLEKNSAESGVSLAQLNLATANTVLSTARNADADSNGKLDSDANLAAEKTAALAAVNNDSDGSATKALYDAVNTANASLSADVTAHGDSVALLTGLRTAVANLIDAGVAVTTDLDGVGAGTATFADLLSQINSALTADAAAKNTLQSDALVHTLAIAGIVDQQNGAGSTVTATDKAYNDAVAAVENRDTLKAATVTAEGNFTATAEGTALRTAEAAVALRDTQIKAVADDQTALSNAQSYLAEVNTKLGAIEAAEAKVETAQDAIVAQGYALQTGLAATAGKDLFVADLSDATADYALTGLATGDKLFIGTQYQFGGATSATVNDAQLFAAGSSSALEVFLTGGAGSNVVVNVETKAFASNEAAPANDLVSITLNGVTDISHVSFDNGFITVA